MHAGVMPYIDLQLWSAVRHLRFSNLDLANAILSGQAQGPDTIRNTTQTHVRQLMDESSPVYRGLIAEGYTL
jgi:hypothetical protein